MRHAWRGWLCGGMLLAVPAVHAQDEESDAGWHGGAWVVSDYVFRGVSQSQGAAAGQGELYYKLENGFYAGLWGSSVDFTGDADADDGVDFEVDPYIGWAFAIGETITADVLLIRQVYLDPVPGIDYDYNELDATLWFGDSWFVHTALSNDVFASGANGFYFSGGGEWSVTDALSVRAEVGWYDLDDAVGDSYGDWQLSGTYTFARGVLLGVAYTDTTSYGAANEDYVGSPGQADGRVVATIGVEF
jgi:uncharacterized protein (TIGR02001 family)